ncbi:hypothetical protein B0T21DRAFT_351407 [Apiosordaria backusii]|uniref:Uncharacterized protein n=1 Tax=Apiosordaria backusii TaxID=314023 RepID=A0AA40AT00_9PEZI|nr:hypothetical protein B0T21DRAFT_351407 [Apiosordaria backusii]
MPYHAYNRALLCMMRIGITKGITATGRSYRARKLGNPSEGQASAGVGVGIFISGMSDVDRLVSHGSAFVKGAHHWNNLSGSTSPSDGNGSTKKRNNRPHAWKVGPIQPDITHLFMSTRRQTCRRLSLSVNSFGITKTHPLGHMASANLTPPFVTLSHQPPPNINPQSQVSRLPSSTFPKPQISPGAKDTKNQQKSHTVSQDDR